MSTTARRRGRLNLACDFAEMKLEPNAFLANRDKNCVRPELTFGIVGAVPFCNVVFVVWDCF